MMTLSVFPLGGIIFGAGARWRKQEVERCFIYRVDGGMSRRDGAVGPGGGCVKMDVCRTVELSGAMVVSTTGWR
jgi:hypothetical protein